MGVPRPQPHPTAPPVAPPVSPHRRAGDPGNPDPALCRVIDALVIRRWLAAGLDALSAVRGEIDALNVYPLPDGDTGSNLLRTWEDVAQGVEACEPDDLPGVLAAVRRHALLGARGNSGVILGGWLSALAATLAETAAGAGDGDPGVCDGPAFARALAAAATAAPTAVADPVAGTILTVAAAAAVPAGTLAVVTAAAAREARAALAATPGQLPALAAAGVVDAGGRGLVVLLEALESVVHRRPLLHVPPPGGAAGLQRALVAARESGSPAYGYEVQYLLEADPGAVAELRSRLAGLGDSLVVAGEHDAWNVHVHVNDVGAALECGVEAGRPYRVTVTRFADQRIGVQPHRSGGRRIVVVVEGDGLVGLFEAEGAIVLDGGRPSVRELVAAMASSGAGEIALLPCDADLLATAQQAAAAARESMPGLAVVVVPNSSPVQGLAAVSVARADRPFGDDVVAMAEASGSTRAGAVVVATTEALTSVGRCQPGDVLGVLDRDVALLGTSLVAVTCDLVDRMLTGGGELVTVVTGSGLDPAVAQGLASHLEASHPFVETTWYDGGQSTALLLGVE